ncbi:MAG: hypothetical protein OEW11_10980 [Nitrospirota bacterium]|nr:hypothetical protein [Nitrospirota bacterium]
MRLALPAVTLTIACTLLLAACAHDNGRHEGQRKGGTTFEDVNRDTTHAAQQGGAAARGGLNQLNNELTDFFKGLHGK